MPTCRRVERSLMELMRAAHLLLIVVAAAAVSSTAAQTTPTLTVTSFEALTTPANAGTRTGDSAVSIDLEMAPARVVGPSNTFTTRVFNGMLPGPTWRVRRGDTVTVTYTNALGPEPDNYVLNEFGHVNTTNLHTHGLHIDSATGSDDIFLYVHPESSFTYTFKVDEAHMPGTHWYHPHVHGSTALQAGGGAFGVLIVEDEEETLPEEIADLPEVILAINHMNTRVLAEIAAESRDALFSVTQTNTVTSDTDLVFVNGQHQPVISMEAGQWVRWRSVMASVEQKLELTLSGCEMQLLAKDGVYLNVAPRTITTIHLAPGGRADVAVRCPSAGSYDLVSGAAGRRRRQLQQNDDRDDDGGGGNNWQGGRDNDRGGGDTFVGVIATVEVAPSSDSASAGSLSQFTVPRPCYLVDLTGVEDSQVISGFALDLGRDNQINGQTFKASDDFITTMAVGSVQQWDVRGIDNHPLHLHVNPFQISALQERGATDPYFQVGDWHDVLQIETAERGTIRFQTNVHTGKLVVHCHILEHEDRGMMAVAQVTGDAGSSWVGAKSIDPTCQAHGSTTQLVNSTSAASATKAPAGMALRLAMAILAVVTVTSFVLVH